MRLTPLVLGVLVGITVALSPASIRARQSLEARDDFCCVEDSNNECTSCGGWCCDEYYCWCCCCGVEECCGVPPGVGGVSTLCT